MAKIFEVRYKDKSNTIVAHQHSSEHFAKLDAKQVSKDYGRAMLGEMDYENNNFFRVVEFAGGVQGKWENRNGGINPCKILLTLEDTKQDEPNVSTQPKAEMTEEERLARKEALARLREANNKKKETEKKNATPAANEKRSKLVAERLAPDLIELVLQSGVHHGSPNYKLLLALHANGVIDSRTYKEVTPKELNSMMVKLRGLLMSNNTGKSITTYGGSKDLRYKLVDFKLELIEEEVA